MRGEKSPGKGPMRSFMPFRREGSPREEEEEEGGARGLKGLAGVGGLEAHRANIALIILCVWRSVSSFLASTYSWEKQFLLTSKGATHVMCLGQVAGISL